MPYGTRAMKEQDEENKSEEYESIVKLSPRKVLVGVLVLLLGGGFTRAVSGAPFLVFLVLLLNSKERLDDVCKLGTDLTLTALCIGCDCINLNISCSKLLLDVSC